MDKFERERKNLADALKEAAEEMGLKCIEKVIPFTNDDVPKYLRRLKKFEDESRKASIMVGCYELPLNYF